MQDSKYYTNEWVNCPEVIKTDVITEKHHASNKQELNEAFLSTNNSELQDLSQLIQNFNKINIKEIDPIALSNEREKLLFEKGFNRIVDEINDLIFKLNNKGIDCELEKQQVIKYFDDYNIDLKVIYDWLLCNQVNTNSIFILGYFNYRGIVANQNNEKAFKLFINASEKDHILAQYFVGISYFFGNGIMKNEKLALEYLEITANKNFLSGQKDTGYCYSKGIGVDKDITKAFYWFEKAAIMEFDGNE
jgi:hypothetical protein